MNILDITWGWLSSCPKLYDQVSLGFPYFQSDLLYSYLLTKIVLNPLIALSATFKLFVLIDRLNTTAFSSSPVVIFCLLHLPPSVC